MAGHNQLINVGRKLYDEPQDLSKSSITQCRTRTVEVVKLPLPIKAVHSATAALAVAMGLYLEPLDMLFRRNGRISRLKIPCALMLPRKITLVLTQAGSTPGDRQSKLALILAASTMTALNLLTGKVKEEEDMQRYIFSGLFMCFPCWPDFPAPDIASYDATWVPEPVSKRQPCSLLIAQEEQKFHAAERTSRRLGLINPPRAF